MTISYTPEGGSSVSLAGAESDLADGPLGMEGGAESAIQQEAIVRAAYPFRASRGNRVYTISFTVRRKHTDYEAAHAAWLAHVQAFNNVGSCVFTQGSATLTLTKAQVTARGSIRLGATTEWVYTVTGIKT